MPFDVPGTGFLHHMNLVTVRKEKVTMATIPVGTVLDPRAMTPEALADIDKARSLPIVTAKDAVHIAHDFGGGGQAAYRIKNPAARPIELQVSSIHGAREWLVYPSHAHVTIDPGEEKIVSFLFRREGDDGKCFVVPRLSFQVDYVAADRRVSLPEIVVDVPTRIEFTKEDLAATRERVAIFDGRRSCLSVASSAVRLPAKDPFTVEAWVRPTNLRGMRIVVGKTENSEFLLGVQDGEPKFYVHVGEGYVILDTGETIPKGVWTHLAAVRDETEVRLYVNGKLANRAAVSGPRTLNTMPLYVGAEPDAAGRPQMFFAGRMDLVRISGCARYAGESFEPAVKLAADEKTRLLLKMDTNRGPYLPDHSASGAHAVRKGPVVLEPATVVPGK